MFWWFLKYSLTAQDRSEIKVKLDLILFQVQYVSILMKIFIREGTAQYFHEYQATLYLLWIITTHICMCYRVSYIWNDFQLTIL